MTQRIIKFRAYVTNGPAVRVYENVGLLNGLVLDSKGEVINKAVLMQFTGLLDKNGKEIYEGDVARRFDYPLFDVKWPFYFVGETETEYEVIGNIYEHPTLISHPLT